METLETFQRYFREHWLSVIVDLALIVFVLVRLLRALRGSLAFNILIGLITVYVLWWVLRILHLNITSTILGEFTKVGVLAILIVFQQEIRKFLMLLGKNSLSHGNDSNWKNMLPWNWNLRESQVENNFEAIAAACNNLSSTKTGALMVFPKSTELKFFAMTGEIMDARVSQRLIESVFVKNSPLHDGAAIIHNNRIKAAGCVLPVSENPDLPPGMGLRHRAAMGITEQSDAIALVISEETGKISLIKEGKITEGLRAPEVMTILTREFAGTPIN